MFITAPASTASSGIRLQLGSATYDPEDPFGRMFFNPTATFAEVEADLISQRTKEGMAVAKPEGKLRGCQSRFTAYQQQRNRDVLVSGKS